MVRIEIKIFGSDFTNQVGTGSSAHCLLGQHPSRRLISGPVTVVNAVIRQSDGQMADRCTDPAVDSRMVFTLLWKNITNSLEVKCASAFFE